MGFSGASGQSGDYVSPELYDQFCQNNGFQRQSAYVPGPQSDYVSPEAFDQIYRAFGP